MYGQTMYCNKSHLNMDIVGKNLKNSIPVTILNTLTGITMWLPLEKQVTSFYLDEINWFSSNFSSMILEEGAV